MAVEPWVEQALVRKSNAPSKRMSIAEAVERFVRPQQVVQIGDRGIPLGSPQALLNEIIRQFYNKDPEFTIVVFGGNANNLAPLVYCGMVKKIISCFLGDSYPKPSPNPILQKAYAEGQIEFEEWTMLTLNLRLMAGALGLPFLPTQSMVGSSMVENNPNFHVTHDPFAEGDTAAVGLVRSLAPDIYFTHAWLADEQGNAVINPPYGGNAYGALAAKEGVIVSAERIVSTEEILTYREHIRIPSSYVKAVVEAPFGSHPSGQPSFPHKGGGGYVEDHDFIVNTLKACRSEETMNDWLEKWILGCEDHGQYLHKLGNERLTALRQAEGISSGEIKQSNVDTTSMPQQPTDEEKMIVAAARKICKTVREKNYRSIFTGIGAAHLACWLAYYLLQDEGYNISLLVDNGLNGYVPLPGDAYLFASQNIVTGESYNDIFHTLGVFVQGAQAQCLAVMGAAQIDGGGNINSSKIPQTSTYLMGAGGGNDAASGAAEVMVVVKQSKHRFRENVDYITSPGHRVRTIVTQYGVFQKNGHDKFCLTEYVYNPINTEAEIIQLIHDHCSWPFSVASPLTVIEQPKQEEITILRSLDQKRYFLGKH